MKKLLIATLFLTMANMLFSQEILKIVWLEKYEWKLLSNQDNDKMNMINIIPRKETEENWTVLGQMMSLKGVLNANLDDIKDLMFEQTKATSPNATLTFLEKDEKTEFPWIIFKIENPEFKDDKKPESQLWYVRQGKIDLYINFIAVKEKKLEDDFVKEWTEVFKKSEVIELKKDNKMISEKLHANISQMLVTCQALSPKPSEYIVFNSLESPENEWLILIFFPDKRLLNEAIKNGVCYQIHQYIWHHLNQMDDFKNLNKTIFFEAGTLPKEKKQIDKIYSGAVNKLNTLKKESGLSNPKTCNICGHSTDKHQMIGFPDEKTGITSEGWMTCPEKHCNCFRTWSANFTESQRNK